MLKYFFLFYVFAALLVVGVMGFRGDKKTLRPIEVFPDMDRQDKLMGQTSSDFFHSGMGSQKPVAGTAPRGSGEGEFSLEFAEGRVGYYYTGEFEGSYGNGMPDELGLDGKNVQAFLRRGEERYGIYCAMCHGDDGKGKGVVGLHLRQAKNPVTVADLVGGFGQEEYPDGMLYQTITKGKGMMGGYGESLPLRDRWAIVAYVRALQETK